MIETVFNKGPKIREKDRFYRRSYLSKPEPDAKVPNVREPIAQAIQEEGFESLTGFFCHVRALSNNRKVCEWYGLSEEVLEHNSKDVIKGKTFPLYKRTGEPKPAALLIVHALRQFKIESGALSVEDAFEHFFGVRPSSEHVPDFLDIRRQEREEREEKAFEKIMDLIWPA